MPQFNEEIDMQDNFNVYTCVRCDDRGKDRDERDISACVPIFDKLMEP